MAKEKVEVTAPSKVDMESLVAEYFGVDAEIKKQTKRKDQIKELARAYVHEYGSEDSKGSFRVEIEAGKIQDIIRQSVSLDEEKAIELFTDLGLTECLDVVEKVVINEAAVEEAMKTGRLSAEQLQSVVSRKHNFALYIKKPTAKESAEKESETKSLVQKISGFVDALEI